MSFTCLFCDTKGSKDSRLTNIVERLDRSVYNCLRCGFVCLTHTAFVGFPSMKYSEEQKNILSICFRLDWEQSGRNQEKIKKPKTLDDLNQILSNYRPLDPLGKMDNALLNFNKKCNHLGEYISVSTQMDYPHYHCKEPNELNALIQMALEEEIIIGSFSRDHMNDFKIDSRTQSELTLEAFKISTKGYKRLREIQKQNQESNQCFVAMWFAKEMKDVYEQAIAPAIEYIEPDAELPRFKAIKIDNVEHVNDINDEIIAQIRRSRFMVCDLTGYRGGVYFEAGFAYGLGLDVIYTCREDWTREQVLKDSSGNEVKNLLDENGKKIRVRKEGVHFDLAHRNRIQWSSDDLPGFRKALENRIKALII